MSGSFLGVSKIGVPQIGWFVIEHPIKMDDLGVPLFSETSIFKYTREEGVFKTPSPNDHHIWDKSSSENEPRAIDCEHFHSKKLFVKGDLVKEFSTLTSLSLETMLNSLYVAMVFGCWFVDPGFFQTSTS